MRYTLVFIVFSVGAAQATELPMPRQYWCSLERVVDVVGGQQNFDDAPYQDHRRPTLSSFPHEDQSQIAFFALSDDGTVYAYSRLAGEGAMKHMIHGVFDFETARLITTRSNLLATNNGAWLSQAVSFTSVCTEVEN